MLVEFKFENFRAFKDETIFSMELGRNKNKNPNNYTTLSKFDNEPILKSAGIFGSNASGKSTILIALKTFRNLVLNSTRYPKGKRIDEYNSFRLDVESSNSPTKFSIQLIAGNKKYIYQISFNKQQILSETLFYTEKSRLSTIFERYKEHPTGERVRNYLEIGDYYYYFPTDFRAIFKSLAKITNENSLFLSKTREGNVAITDDIYNWFENILIIQDFGTEIFDFKPTSNFYLENELNHNIIFKFLSCADFGVDDIKIEKQQLRVLHSDRFDNDEDPLKKGLETEDFFRPIIIRKKIRFDLITDESEGTKKLYSILGPIIRTIINNGILLFDELDVKLHPLLCELVLNFFNNPQNQTSQLIFTTHNTNLLNQEILRRDQIWFTEKDPHTFISKLYSLLEYKVRNDKVIELGYLAGKYGAIPFVQECGDIWHDIQKIKEKKQ